MTRKATDRVLELIDEGIIRAETVALAALKYMSEDEVADMARINDFDLFLDEEDEEEEDEDEEEDELLVDEY